MYDFDTVIDRSATDSVKYSKEAYKRHFSGNDVLPFWVADMDFRCAPAIVDAVVRRAEEGIYGYPETGGQNAAFARWVARRHGWEIEEEWVVNTSGVVPALNAAVRAFTMPGDGVIVQNPVYHPFVAAIENNGRRPLFNDLVIEGGQYAIDFADLERKAALPTTTLMILCSPHNPGGRVWTPEELSRIVRICEGNDVVLVSDEIHCDLVMPGYRHTVCAGLPEAGARNVVTCMAPSKTFNLAGMHFAVVTIPNPRLRERFKRVVEQGGEGKPGSFAMAAAIAAWDHCEDWLDECVAYLAENVRFTQEYLGSRIEGVGFFEQQATYLVWMDFRSLGVSDEELERLMYEEAHVGLDAGTRFGSGGSGFMRMNVACPRSVVREGLDRMVETLSHHGYGRM